MMNVSSQLAWTSTPQSNYSFNSTACSITVLLLRSGRMQFACARFITSPERRKDHPNEPGFSMPRSEAPFFWPLGCSTASCLAGVDRLCFLAGSALPRSPTRRTLRGCYAGSNISRSTKERKPISSIRSSSGFIGNSATHRRRARRCGFG